MILPGGSASEQLEQGVLAEEAGWDGVFVWEAAYGVDAWGLLTAIAARTSRIRLGTMLTPLPWRRPWKVASQVVTLDQISAGRATLAVGLGAIETDLPRTGEELDLRTRAAMLDEGIDLIRELWAGRSQYHGVYYDYSCPRDDLVEVGRPVQDRIPIWVVGAWPRPKSMRRVLRCDGVLPQFRSGEDSPAEMRVLRTWLSERGAAPELDVIAEGETAADDREAAVREVAPWADAGATWWLETRWEMPHHSAGRMRDVRERIAAGPPRA
ncbi:LLM class flavin-dependent oxidoreductase [Kribbella qitaiheensis]|uniref:LLM class flavin-dependent oxidoreductase n=1 Tax=Kribbella qitaiheensis TaxID=1544730 RepID=UPI001FE9E4B6|nr:LLM class flavin-dependent oxidoreductase [Kribbella qitaiheensis]